MNHLQFVFYTEGNGRPYQDSCCEKKVNGEDICEDHLAIGHQQINGSKKICKTY